jgi:putative phosphoesterase
MKIAVISDIHGNNVAFQAVLEDLIQQGPVDHLVFGGDFFAPGAATQTILQTIEQYPQAVCLMGNTDRYLLEKSYALVYNGDGWQRDLRHAFQWTRSKLGRAELSFLATLRASHLIEAGSHRLLAVHGSPRSDEEGLNAATSTEELARMGLDSQVSLLTCGHTHIPMDRMIGGVRVINSGSVGIPFDGDPRACYALISNLEASEPAEVRVELRRISYDIEAAVNQFYAFGHPAAEMGAYNLRYARPQGSTSFYTEESVHKPTPLSPAP